MPRTPRRFAAGRLPLQQGFGQRFGHIFSRRFVRSVIDGDNLCLTRFFCTIGLIVDLIEQALHDLER